MTLHQFDVLMTIMTALAQRYSGGVDQDSLDLLLEAADAIAAHHQRQAKTVEDEPAIDRTPGWEAA